MSFVLHCYKLQMTKTVSVKQAKNKLQKRPHQECSVCVCVDSQGRQIFNLFDLRDTVLL